MKLENIIKILKELAYIKITDKYNDGEINSITFRYGNTWWKLSEQLESFFLTTFGSTMMKLMGNKTTNASTIAKWINDEINTGDAKCLFNDTVNDVIDKLVIKLIGNKEER